MAALQALKILDSPREERFDRITRTASRLFDVPIALVSLVDANRQWFKSCLGLDLVQTDRSASFCAHALLEDGPLVIADTHADPRFADNPLVTGAPHVRFYAGHPLSTPAGYKMGTLCLIDREPRSFGSSELAALKDLASWAESELNGQEVSRALEIQRRSEAQVRAVLNATSEAIALLGPDGALRSINRRFTSMFGLEPEDVLGRDLELLEDSSRIIFGDPDMFRRLAAEATAAMPQPYTASCTQVHPSARQLSVYSTRVQVPDEAAPGLMLVFRDVTREHEVDRMKSEFVSLVSHELRTPLTSVKGYVDLLLDGDAGELTEDQQDLLRVVQSNADRLVALINDLLDVSRIESGTMQLRRTTVDLRALVDAVVRSLRPALEAKNQQLDVAFPSPFPSVSVDPDRLTQVLTNLVSNAHKYTPDGGTIAVRVRFSGAVLTLEVSDNGIGISPEDRGRLFSRFFRSADPAAHAVGGTGLGLVITRSLVELHGGTIDVTSTHGIGSTFTVTLPSVAGSSSAAEPTVSSVAGRVLIVEDEPDIAGLLCRYLERAGYAVLVASTVAQALTLARTGSPDLITLDLVLPDGDGFAVLEALKNDPTTAGIPVLVVSAMDESGPARLLGAVDYLRKPVEETKLLQRIGQHALQGRARSVLVADDDSDARSLLKRFLEREGLTVLEAADGDEAVEQARRHHPDLALIDIRMPKTDGIGALRRLRADPATRDLHVIMMTASGTPSDSTKTELWELGASLLGGRSCTAEQLAETIAESFRASSPVRPVLT
ncbi:MAG: response regulator [Actinomycetota bacterium]|nr:response regulator [Actinomycetota bacterium]